MRRENYSVIMDKVANFFTKLRSQTTLPCHLFRISLHCLNQRSSFYAEFRSLKLSQPFTSIPANTNRMTATEKLKFRGSTRRIQSNVQCLFGPSPKRLRPTQTPLAAAPPAALSPVASSMSSSALNRNEESDVSHTAAQLVGRLAGHAINIRLVVPVLSICLLSSLSLCKDQSNGEERPSHTFIPSFNPPTLRR